MSHKHNEQDLDSKIVWQWNWGPLLAYTKQDGLLHLWEVNNPACLCILTWINTCEWNLEELTKQAKQKILDFLNSSNLMPYTLL